ncbi:ATP-binding protein [Brucella cytisi]|uniref:ATP-binding protein n=1 Tax=Brucella cytisi TaxID=407152 RepID=UPI0035D7F9E7
MTRSNANADDSQEGNVLVRILDGRDILRIYRILAVAIILLAFGVGLYSQIREINRRIHDVGENNLVLANILSVQTTNMFGKLNALARAVAEDVQDPLVSNSMLPEILERRIMAEPDALSITFADARGRIVASSDRTTTGDLSALPVLKKLKSEEKLLVSAGPASRQADSQRWLMNYALKLLDLNHNPAGYVVIEVDLVPLYESYQRVVERTDAVLGLIGDDGIIRIASGPEAVGQNVGPLVEKIFSAGGGVETLRNIRTGEMDIFGFSRSASVPMLTYVGSPRKTVVISWLTSLAIVTIIFLILCGLLLLGNFILARYVSNRNELLRQTLEAERQKQFTGFLNEIIQASGVLVAVTDVAGQPIVTNQFFQSMFDIDDPGLSERLLESSTGLSLSAICDQAPCEVTHIVEDRQGQKRELDWRLSPIRDDAGKVKNLVAIGIDNTAQRHLELAIFQSSKLITLGEMATGLAHEINQPLGTLVLTLDHVRDNLARKKKLTVPLEDHLAGMSHQLERVTEIADHLRTFGRRGDGIAVPIDINKVIDGALLVTRHRIEQAGIQLIRPPVREYPEFLANQTILEQILINLLINSCDAIVGKRESVGLDRDDSIEISVRENKESMTLAVADTGGGIPLEVAEHIFEPFFTTKPVGQGTGLGLSVSYGMARAFGGELGFRNLGSTGAEFAVNFPKSSGEKKHGSVQ